MYGNATKGWVKEVVKDQADVNERLTAVENKANTNAENIAKNSEDISKNSEDISQNTEDIATNTAAIETNAGNIAQNTEDIATNTAAINTISTEIVQFTHPNITYPLILRKIGKLVVFNSYISVSANIGIENTLMESGTIPEGYRPNETQHIAVYGDVCMEFFTDGRVILQNISGTLTSGWHDLSGCYFTA